MKLKWWETDHVAITTISDICLREYLLKVSFCQNGRSEWRFGRRDSYDTRWVIEGHLESKDHDACKAEAVDNVKHWLREMAERWEGVEA